MSNKNAIRAWKDEDFRLSLSQAELVELTEEQLGLVGGASVQPATGCCSMGCPSMHCHTITQ